MRLSPLLVVLAASACSTTDHAVTGQYLTSYDAVEVSEAGGEVASSVVEVTLADATGVLDHAFFHSDSVAADFTTSVPDGAVEVHVAFVSHTGDLKDVEREFVIAGPIDGDVDFGTVDLTGTLTP